MDSLNTQLEALKAAYNRNDLNEAKRLLVALKVSLHSAISKSAPADTDAQLSEANSRTDFDLLVLAALCAVSLDVRSK